MDAATPNIIVNPEKFELALHANEDCTFELTNVGYEAVIYRVRTTAPLRYYLKHSKGVVKGNSSAKITISLNRKHFAEGTTPGQQYTKDTFRVECAVLGEQDVVEAHGANLANLIQKKKELSAAAVVQKYIYCRVLLGGGEESAEASSAAAGAADASALEDASATSGNVGGRGGSSVDGANAAAGAGGEAAATAQTRRAMTAKQQEQKTLKEKHRRTDGGQCVVRRGGQPMLVQMGVAAVLVLLFAMWLMRGSGEAAEMPNE